jgi:hypothetical protein
MVANHRALRGLALFTCAAALVAQAPTQNPPPGLETDWDIAVTLKAISAHAERLLPLLEQIDVYAWVEKGASDTYLAQLQSSKVQARALSEGAKMLAASPQKLSASLELFLRINGLDTMLTSLEEGIRKYQGPAGAQAIASLEAENGANLERFQRYIVDLAAQRERELEVMDHEAQRCRGIVTQAAPRPGRKK